MTHPSMLRSPIRLQSGIADSNIDAILEYHHHLRRLEEYVEINISSSFQLADIATDIGVSSSRLSHLFVEKTGIPYSQWIRHKRVRAASKLLACSDRSVLDVAISVGYTNVRSFERAFKQTTGMTPTGFRDQVAPQILSQS